MEYEEEEDDEEYKDWTDEELANLSSSDRRRMASEAMNIKDSALLPKKILLNANMTQR